MIKARILVMPKPGVLDPQGKAVETALERLGFAGVNGVRQGKVFEFAVDEDDRAAAARAHRGDVRPPARQPGRRKLARRTRVTLPAYSAPSQPG